VRPPEAPAHDAPHLAQRRHHAVLDAVVHHLDVVPTPRQAPASRCTASRSYPWPRASSAAATRRPTPRGSWRRARLDGPCPRGLVPAADRPCRQGAPPWAGGVPAFAPCCPTSRWTRRG
jgi:hypothetical protein